MMIGEGNDHFDDDEVDVDDGEEVAEINADVDIEVDIEDDFIDCEVGETVFTDVDGNKFLVEITVRHIQVRVGEFVEVNLDEESNGFRTGYGQVLAIFDDVKNSEGIKLEVRWLDRIEELTQKQQRTLQQQRGPWVLGNLLHPELIETDKLDNISAGAILCKVFVIGNDFKKRNGIEALVDGSNVKESCTIEVAANSGRDVKKRNATEAFHVESFPKECSTLVATGSTFVCRMMVTCASNSLFPVSNQSIFSRGLRYSYYQHAYTSLDSVVAEEVGNLSKDPYSDAIRQLHVSVIPANLPCRNTQLFEITSLVRDFVQGNKTSRSAYISGMPGTGKTATVLASIKGLQAEKHNHEIPDFDFIEINCLRMHAAADAYTQFWRAMNGEIVSSNTAKLRIEEYLNQKTDNQQPLPIVCLLDELDFLITKNENIVYNFFNWSMSCNFLLLIGVSNVSDLPERLTTRVSSRFNANTLTRMVFPPYTHTQIKEILESRLGEVGISFFMQTSLEMLSRKASSITGDLRGALKICQRAIELHLERKKEKDATNQQEMDATHQFSTSNSSTSSGRQFIAFDIIIQAVNEYSQSPMMMFMRHSCLLDRRLLAVICKHCLVCGCNTITVDMIWRRLETFHNLVLSQIGDLQPPLLFPTTQQFYTAVERLEDTGLINIANKYRRNGSTSISPVGEVSLVAELMDVVCAIKDTSRLYLEVLIKL